jgi:hypothetical protein
MRSVPGLTSLAVGILGGFGVGMMGGPLLGVLAGLVVTVVLAALWLTSGLGPRMVVADREHRDWIAGQERLTAARTKQRRLAALRIPDPEVRKALDLVALQAGLFLAACGKARLRDPLAEDAIAESLELADLYLKELDDASTERRFGLPDNDPFENAAIRVGNALRDKAAILEKARLDIEGGLTGADRMSIKEQL